MAEKISPRVSCVEFAAIMEKYDLRSMAGARLVAKLLYITPQTVCCWYEKNRKIRRTEMELLEIKLADLRAKGKL